jgi:hypothetical protein
MHRNIVFLLLLLLPGPPSKSASGQVIVLKQIDDMGKPTVQIIVNCKLGIVLNVNMFTNIACIGTLYFYFFFFFQVRNRNI